jgi:DNA-binding winged helix-turn-helix (wHTH) protein
VTARFGAFTLDADQRQLTSDAGGELHLTPKAFDLLALLIEEAPRVMRKAELHEKLWPGSFVSDATLVGLVKEIRKALNDPGAPLIRTAHGVGYAFAGVLERVTLPRKSALARWIVAGARRISLNDGENVVGRDPACAVWLDTGGVSRRHARVLVSEDDAFIEDLESKNGTTLDDKPVTGRVKLRDGDRIQVGPILIVYHVSASGISTETLSHTTRER